MSKKEDNAILSRVFTLESVLVSTVSELTSHTEDETLKVFKQSKTRKKLFNFENGLYNKDISIIRDEFLNECINDFGWDKTSGC